MDNCHGAEIQLYSSSPAYMLSINDLKNKMAVMIDGAPFQVLEVRHLHMGRGGSSVQTRIKNLATGQMFSRNFKPSDVFEEAEVEKRELIYLYNHRGQFVFAAKPPRAPGTPAEGLRAAKGKPSERYSLETDQLGETVQWLKADLEVSATFLGGRLLNVSPPIKVELKVIEAPPGFKGDTATGGTKTVIVETGAKIQTPLFVNEDDIIRVNTETGEYVERVTKG